MDSLPGLFDQAALPPELVPLFLWLSVGFLGLSGGSAAFAVLSRPRKSPQAAAASAAAGQGILTRMGEFLVRALRWKPEQDGRVERWQAWHALSGQPLSLPLMWGVSVCLGLAGLSIGSMITFSFGLLLGGIAAVTYPVLIGNRVAGLRADFTRGLPTTIILLMAEHRAGSSIEGALELLAERPGLVSRFFAQTLAETRQGAESTPLFSRGERQGALAARAQRLRLPELQHLVHTLETVENQGQAANRVMERLNDMQVIELTKKGRDRINGLSQRLVFIIALFFLGPIMALMLYSLFVPLIEAF